ncbi:heme peroxidase family protein [Conexibacter sp. CPCC 206217]|uniref:peroxidase family protein n=1 Tax=Conexibacter sp. CPCC 206217 TaxID=3064574 RepID=UPI002725CE15|nr:heme peroxidase family protein [Conexibacter sp. CPCC 206217]MDO8211284.1 heme peroxidase family protein [Conexibacter sp. CPCC 206217]
MAGDELGVTTHGGITPRGLDSVPKSALFEGRFGRIFRTLPVPAHDDGALRRLGDALPEETGVGATADNPAIPSAYTYFGQFVDHDITFDPVSQLQRVNDPDALVDFRTPRFDLDSVYGAGPTASPFLYESRDATFRGVKLLVGRNPATDPLQGGDPLDPQDLPRNEQGRALIGDPRNDENIVVSQLQLAFLKLHDRAADRVRSATRLGGAALFDETRRLVTWHYQWVVVHDFLTRIVGAPLVRDVLTNGRRFFSWENTPFMPVEFSAAAYRFGHSMVRPGYDLNETVTGVPIFSGRDRPGTFESLHGFRRLPSLWTIDWSHFAPLTRRRPQPSRKINIRLAPPLMRLPISVDAQRNPLAVLNLLRGRALQLPSGQAVAGAMQSVTRIPPLSTAHLALGRLRLPAAARRAFEAETPLWFYVLREAEVHGRSAQLGPVGGRIVAEVLIGLLEADPGGFLKQEPGWRPGRGAVALPSARRGDFTLADLLRFATT